MDIQVLEHALSIGTGSLSTVIAGYVAFRKTNVDKLCKLLIDSGLDLSKIGKAEKRLRHFYDIVEKVSKEVAEEKIENWKNLTLKLATDFNDYDFTETYSKILADLSAFDLVVLFAIYTREFKSPYFSSELIEYFDGKGVHIEKVEYSIKALSRHNLIKEEANGITYLYGADTKHSQPFHYSKNIFGESFLKVIS